MSFELIGCIASLESSSKVPRWARRRKWHRFQLRVLQLGQMRGCCGTQTESLPTRVCPKSGETPLQDRHDGSLQHPSVQVIYTVAEASPVQQPRTCRPGSVRWMPVPSQPSNAQKPAATAEYGVKESTTFTPPAGHRGLIRQKLLATSGPASLARTIRSNTASTMRMTVLTDE